MCFMVKCTNPVSLECPTLLLFVYWPSTAADPRTLHGDAARSVERVFLSTNGERR